MQTYKGEGAKLHVFLTSVLGGSERSAVLPPWKFAHLRFEYDARWPQNLEVKGNSFSAGGESIFLGLIPYRNHRTACPIWCQFFLYVRIFDTLEICNYNLKFRVCKSVHHHIFK